MDTIHVSSTGWDVEEEARWDEIQRELDAMIGMPVDWRFAMGRKWAEDITAKIRGTLDYAETSAAEPKEGGKAYRVGRDGWTTFRLDPEDFQTGRCCPGWVELVLPEFRIEIGRVNLGYNGVPF
jgi:hypothetical protein